MFLYRLISILIYPLLALFLFYRVYKKKEDKIRLKERFGYASTNRPEGRIIWVHAVSVGEANSALTLIEELLKFSSEISILFTTTTLTSAEIIAKKLPAFHGRVIHQFLPLDSYFCVKRFLNFWKIRSAIFVESEIWPNFIFEARRLGISSFLVNARISKKSFKKWLFAKELGFNIFDYFAAIFVQMEEDKKRFEQLTNQEILFYGNLKSQAQDLLVDEKKLTELKSQIAARRFWLASSTHRGEEEFVIDTHKKLKKDFPDLLTILVPRHPNRVNEIKLLLKDFKVAKRSKNETITNTTDFYIADTLGEMGIFYSLAPFTFLGGSLFPIGGHNPFEPIKLGCTVITGRDTFNFKEIYEKLEKENACTIINSGNELPTIVKNFLQNSNNAQAISHKALKLMNNSENIAKKIVKKIDQILMLQY